MNDEKSEKYENPSDERLAEILKTHKNVAVAGLTPKQESPANRVARFLKRHGFRIYPVNPRYESVLGEIAWPYIRNISEPVDIIDVFRRPEHLEVVMDRCMKKEYERLVLLRRVK